MQVQASDSFFKSLKTLIWHQSPIYRTYSLFRYRLPGFIKNVWRFRRELWSHRWWDYRFTLEMLYRSLSIMVVRLEKDGIEEDVSRGKKVAKIKRALELLKHKLDDDYVERAEKELGELYSNPWEFEPTEDGNYRLIDNDTKDEKEHNSKVFKLAHKLEDKEWIELWNILKGTKYSKTWGDKFDGTDMRGWWD